MSQQVYEKGYLQALADLEEKLDNAKANEGGIDVGNGRFIQNAHWHFEIQDQINELKGQYNG